MSVSRLLEGSLPQVKDSSFILAVNDDFNSLTFLGAILRDDSVSIVRAGDAAVALEMARDAEPDLVISDVLMPGIDGIELCRRLKSDSATCDIPVLLMTAERYDDSATMDWLRAGADDFVASSAPIEVLREKIQTLVADHQRVVAVRHDREKHFRAMIENSLDIVTILNSDGTIRYESPSVEVALGYQPAELIGRSAFELIHPDDVQNVLDVFTRGIQNENHTESMEFRYRHKDGSWRFLESIGKNLLNEPGVAGIIVNSRDVTDRKRMEAKLRESEERYELAMDTIEDYGIFMLDQNGFVVSWNSGAERISGYHASESMGKHCSWFYREEDVQNGEPEHLRQAAINEGKRRFEGRRVRKDGSEVWVDGVLTALRDDQGQLKGFLKVNRDISERRLRQNKLWQSEQLLSAIMDNSPALIYVKDLEGRYITVNRQFESRYGLTGEIVGKTAHDIFPAEMADLCRAQEQSVIESGKPFEVQETGVYEGQCRYYISTIFPLIDQTGAPTGICGISTDITAHKSLEEQLRHSQKMEAIGMLAGGIAHDFNNQLTAISGYSQLLLRGFDKTDRRFEHLEEIENAAKRASALTAQLLTFSRKQVLRPSIVDLNLLIENLTKMLRRLIGEDIELVAVPGGQLGAVTADPGSLEQVIVNLVVNSRDAMPRGGKVVVETANVDLESGYTDTHLGVPSGRYVMLAVSDAGCGMDNETQARIFDPFFTTKDPGKGTGLGLSTVYGIVKQSRGHIWVYSEPGHGSTFKIYLPRTDEAVASTPAVEAPLTRSYSPANILLVEDDEAVRRLTRLILEQNGYNVIEAASAKEALQKSHELDERIDLLVTDVVMPELCGGELATALTKVRPDTKVLYISGYTDEAMKQHGILEPGLWMLQKPFSPQVFLSKVHELLANGN